MIQQQMHDLQISTIGRQQQRRCTIQRKASPVVIIMTAKTRILGEFGIHIGAVIHQGYLQTDIWRRREDRPYSQRCQHHPHQRRKPSSHQPAAQCNAVKPPPDAFMFAPFSTRNFATSRLLIWEATTSGIAVNVADFHLGACVHSRTALLTSFERAAKSGVYMTLGKCVDIGVRLDERPNHIRMLLCDGPHQSRLALHFLRFDIRPMREKRLHAFDTAGARRKHERRCTAIESYIRLGASRQQRLDRGCIARLAGKLKRRRAQIVRGVDVGASLDQQLHKIGINSMGRPVQRRGTVRITNVHIGLALEIGANRSGITVLRGINQPHIVFDGRERGRREGDGQQQERRSGQNGNTKCQARQHRLPPRLR